MVDECCVLDPGPGLRAPSCTPLTARRHNDGSKPLGKREFYNRIEQIGGIGTSHP